VQAGIPAEIAAAGEASGFAGLLAAVLSERARAELVFQPIVDMRDAVVTGYEALARFPAEAGLAPNVWFEKAGLLGRRNELQRLMMRKALSACERLPENCFLTVNAGPDYLVSTEWQDILDEFPDLAGVVVEVTEETLVGDYEILRERLNQIRAKGGLVAVDDAGVGYASLQHILEIRPDFIKIDRHFVQNCGLNRARSTMIEMVGAAADRLDASVIAEGVELLSELEELERLKVPLAQGYLLGKPAPEMLALDPFLRETILGRKPKGDRPTMAEHLCSCEDFWTREAAETAMAANTNLRETLVVDVWQRPLELLHRHALVGVRWLTTFMRVQVESHPAEVLDRALARDEALRFDPIVVIGADGETLGVVAVDRLIAGVLGAARG
jgi:EAL domain-containing protein (putative c-di-GMP-specific phosphodiesterase class I)